MASSEPRCRCGQPTAKKGAPCAACQCGARNKNSRGAEGIPPTCTQWPIEGGPRCRMHGGATPQAKAAARERIIEAELRATCGRLKLVPIDDPLTALLEHASVVCAWELHTREQVLALSDYVYDGGAHLGEQERALVKIWERAADRKGKVLVELVRAGISERLVAITESQAERLIGALEAAFATIPGADHAVLEAARMAAGRHLAAVAS